MIDYKQIPLPIKLSPHDERDWLMSDFYVKDDYLPERYETPVSEDKRACEGENPPEACQKLTFDLASEAAVLGGAIGTARKYELYRELTSENWKRNLSHLSRKIANIMDANKLHLKCHSILPYFDRQLRCSDRLRYAARLLEFAYSYRLAPIKAPLSAQPLLQERIAKECRPPSVEAEED